MLAYLIQFLILSCGASLKLLACLEELFWISILYSKITIRYLHFSISVPVSSLFICVDKLQSGLLTCVENLWSSLLFYGENLQSSLLSSVENLQSSLSFSVENLQSSFLSHLNF